ncbi:6-phosphofructo-2-kinase, partial [Cryomyces antarcticus]
MPLICDQEHISGSAPYQYRMRKQSQQSELAKAIAVHEATKEQRRKSEEMPPPQSHGSNGVDGHELHESLHQMDLKPLPRSNGVTNALNGVGTALSDTPLPTAPNSPR